MFIVVGGIDGCGKGTIIKTWAEELTKQGKKIFDLREFTKKNGCFPEYEEIKDFDVILSNEMTYAWVGAALRGEIIQNNSRVYSALSVAQAYALDREVLYRRILVPAMQDKKLILQERTFETSIVYQPLQDGTITAEEIMEIPGNRFALQNRPDIIVIPKLSAKTAIKRLSARTEKQDNCIFERLNFLKRAAEVYYSPWFREFFERHGAKVFYLNTEQDITGTIADAKKLFTEFYQPNSFKWLTAKNHAIKISEEIR
jgi:thymidylate kinase